MLFLIKILIKFVPVGENGNKLTSVQVNDLVPSHKPLFECEPVISIVVSDWTTVDQHDPCHIALLGHNKLFSQNYQSRVQEYRVIMDGVQKSTLVHDFEAYIYDDCLTKSNKQITQNSRHFADDIFKRILLNDNVQISINVSLKFVHKGPINNIPVLVQIMAWRRPDDKSQVIWTNDGLVNWRIYASLGLNGLRNEPVLTKACRLFGTKPLS